MFDDGVTIEELVRVMDVHEADGKSHPKGIRFDATITFHDGHSATGATPLDEDHTQ